MLFQWTLTLIHSDRRSKFNFAKLLLNIKVTYFYYNEDEDDETEEISLIQIKIYFEYDFKELFP